MTNHFLHREIREKGGAYGGRCSYSPLSGTLEMMSYRDPQVLRTVQTFESAVEWASSIKNSVNNVEMDEAKLNIFQVGPLTQDPFLETYMCLIQKIDKPVNASGEVTSLFMYQYIISQSVRVPHCF